MSANPIKQAEKIIKAYAEDLKGLQFEECNDLGFSDNQCVNLMRVLGKGKEGEVTSDERIVLERLQFAKDFIDALAGADGNKALRSRVRWLKDEWYKKGDDDLSQKEILQLLKELSENDQSIHIELSFLHLMQSRDAQIKDAARLAYEKMMMSWSLRVLHNAEGGSFSVAIPFLFEHHNNPEEILPLALEKVLNGDVTLDDFSMFCDNNETVSEMLRKYGNDPIAFKLAELLESGDRKRRYLAATMLGLMGKWATPAIPLLYQMVEEDADADCRIAAQEAIERLKEASR